MTTHTLHSMTGFARVQMQGEWGMAVCELRSINHRYSEISIHLPETLRAAESCLRDQIRQCIKRGKVECYIRYQPNENQFSEMHINVPLMNQLSELNEQIGSLLRNPAAVNTMEIIKWPGILEIEELDFEKIEDKLSELLEKGLKELTAARGREGKELQAVCLKRLEAMENEVKKVKARLPEIMQAQREKLMNRFKDAKVELDPNRLEQEMVMIAQRIDINEELERLSTHIGEVKRIFNQGGLAGRRLDFLMQELHREANTLGSKSVDVDTTRASVELKVLIEQLREQVQNIE